MVLEGLRQTIIIAEVSAIGNSLQRTLLHRLARSLNLARCDRSNPTATTDVYKVQGGRSMQFSESWLIRIGGGLVMCTTALVIVLSVSALAVHMHGRLEAIAVLAFFWGSVGMLLICVGAIFVLMDRRRTD
jgi:hypothetical protein